METALAAARGAREAWEETGRGVAAYAVHGFLAALEACRALGDSSGEEEWARVVEAVCAPLAPTSFGRAALHVARLDREALLGDVDHPVALGERSHLVERALNACLEQGWLPSRESLQRLLIEAQRQGLRPLAAQVHRGLGLHGSRSHLALARKMAVTMGVEPLGARIEAERSTMTGATDKQLAGMTGRGGSR